MKPRRLFALAWLTLGSLHAADDLPVRFAAPPDAARPGVYWYFMDGNQTREGITADLEAMKQAGLGHALYLDVDVGVPRGPVAFLGEEWQDQYVLAVREAERLGLQIMLGSGPGWAGSGGPWIKPEQSMQHLVAEPVVVEGPRKFTDTLPAAKPRAPFFGPLKGAMASFEAVRQAAYGEVAVLAFPTPTGGETIADVDQKALYYRPAFTSGGPSVKPYLKTEAAYPAVPADRTIAPERVVDLTRFLRPDGTLDWDVPPGRWTLLRFVSRNNGNLTRPAPQAGLGFEVDKFSAGALDFHYDTYIGKLLAKVGARRAGVGWTTLHIDSWEMGAQNWTPAFRDEFRARRGYDPQPYYPAYRGYIVGSREVSERFLWDVRRTGSELIVEKHAGHLKERARRDGFDLSIEPYDLNPSNDFDLGAVADVPMGEFWHVGFNSAFSVTEAASIGHVMGRPVIGAEAFTSGDGERWKDYPGSLKDQGDWAFASGINRFTFHTFAHKPDQDRPGMVMGPYGVHWDRGQTWWPMVEAYHRYIARCSEVLRQGHAVADVLYLMPEGAPNVFLPPTSALDGATGRLPDRRGYNFDGCSSEALIKLAAVRDGSVVFPGGASYRLLVLPDSPTMTPALVDKLAALVQAGATLVGNPPRKSPSLTGFPACDGYVAAQANALWGASEIPPGQAGRSHGKGRVVWGQALTGTPPANPLAPVYPGYDLTATLLGGEGLPPDFSSPGPLRYAHRSTPEREIYFVSNRSAQPLETTADFRVEGRPVERWDAVTGAVSPLPGSAGRGGITTVPLQFAPSESCFVVFPKPEAAATRGGSAANLVPRVTLATVAGPWEVSFEPALGGPAAPVRFDALDDWSRRPEPGIKYYSGLATYRNTFDLPTATTPLFLDLGGVEVMARVKVNGQDCGVAWTAPWRVDISRAAKTGRNTLEIEVANRWPNRMIGDLVEKRTPPIAKTTFHPFKATDPLLPSGLVGPVRLVTP